MSLCRGASGESVLRLQRGLIRLGEPLARFGVDGEFGTETLEAAERALEEISGLDSGSVCATDCVSEIEIEFILSHAPDTEADHVAGSAGLPLVRDLRAAADESRRRRRNPIKRIDTVVLHQMACRGTGGAHWERWRRLGIHYAVTWGEDSIAAWMHDLNWRLPHAHGWNRRSVGIEIEGYFAGLHDTSNGNYSRFWRPSSKPDRLPMIPDPMQLEAARQAVEHAVGRIAQLGGRIRYIAAHRQSYGLKSSDPGELLWRGVALPMIADGVLEAYTGGLDHRVYPGKSIPEGWGGDVGESY